MSECTKGCDDSCNSACGCGSTHHHCGCPCHVPPSLDEQHQHAERMATKWLARYQDLSAEVGRVPGTCETVDERRQMRAVIEAMRPIVEAALTWKKAADDPTAEVWKYTERLDAAIDAYRRPGPPPQSAPAPVQRAARLQRGASSKPATDV